MSRFAFGFWTCAALYAAIGVFGVFLIGAQPSIAYSSDGYGTIGTMAVVHAGAIMPLGTR